LWNTFCRATGLTGLFSSSETFNAETFGSWQRDVVRPVDIVSGCFFLIKRKFWNKLGGFDPAFFMYGEEADLCLRAKAYGARPMITPNAVIVHYGGASETTRSSKLIKLLSAKATLIKRHFPDRQKRAGLMLLMIWPLSRWLALHVAAAVTRNRDLITKAQTWHTVWQQREQWRDGWPVPNTPGTNTIHSRSTLPIGASASSVNS
jgi:GT2 family glycosyltransferase